MPTWACGPRVSGGSVAAGDVNKDGFTDFYFGGADRGTLASSDGRGRFREEPGPT